MPISAPNPNCAPSEKEVGALRYTQAASTADKKKSPLFLSSVIIDSL